MAKRRARKQTRAQRTLGLRGSAPKRPTAKKAQAKKVPKDSRQKSATRAATKNASTKKLSTVPKRSTSRKKRPPPTAYERRNKAAKAKGYTSYWDERQSRVRSRKALFELGITDPSVADVDELGTLGRGESARELYYKTKRILERHEPAPSDRQIWALIRIFYRPRGRR